MSNWEYGGVYKKYNMNGIIELPNDSKLQVCDITQEIPEFMFEADTIFSDPPCSQGNLRSFYTKADLELNYNYQTFAASFLEAVHNIRPGHLFVEVFKSNRLFFENAIKDIYPFVKTFDSFYYRKPANKCWMIYGSQFQIDNKYNAINGIDEEEIIKWLCRHHDYNCIGDLCMGRGLIGKHALLNGKKFVGTELNPKRLAVLVDFISSKNKK